MENCHKCSRKAAYRLVDKWYCRKCFCELVEHKIRHNLRMYGLRKDSRLLVTDKACEYVVQKVIHLPVKIVKGKQKSDYSILPWTMDDENEEFLRRFFENSEVIEKDDIIRVKLFYHLSKDEMKSYFAIKSVPYKPLRSEINKMLDNFEKRHVGTKTSLLKSEERLRQMLK